MVTTEVSDNATLMLGEGKELNGATKLGSPPFDHHSDKKERRTVAYVGGKEEQQN